MKHDYILAVFGTLSVSAVGGFNISQSSGAETAKPNHSQAAEPSGQPARSVTGNPDNTTIAQADSAVMYRPGAGTIVVAELTNPLEARKVKVGDLVACKVTQDLLYQGKIIVPREARVVGRITDVTVSSKEQRQSSLSLVFEKIVLKDKKELIFQHPAIVEAVGAPIRRTVVSTNRLEQMPVQMEKGKSTGNSAIDAVQSNPNLMGANFPAMVGAISGSNRGVIGLKELTLDKKNPDQSMIVSHRGDVRLAAQTQLVLRVIDAAK